MKKRELILYVVVAASVLTFAVYGHDKRAAEFNGPSKVLLRPRAPERTLHLLSLAGGWPGALAGQQFFRHKTVKQPFQRVFWLTVLVNLVLVVLLFQ